MRILFLGSGHFRPTPERHCPCAVLDTGGAKYCVDAGGPVPDLLAAAGISPEELRAVFTTHVHGDHTNGLYALADLCNYAFPMASMDVFVTDPGLMDLLRKSVEVSEAGQRLDETRFRLKLMTEDTRWSDGNLTVTPIPTKHMAHKGRPSFAYLMEAEGKRVLFTGDLSQELARDDFPRVALEEPLDLTICEMGHFGPDHLASILPAYRGRALYFQHVYPEDKEAYIPEMDGKWGYPVRLLSDGETVEI